MHTALLALLLAQLALPGQAAPGGLVYPLGADLAAPGSVYQLGPVGTPSLSWTPAVGVYTSPITPTVGPALTFVRASTGTYQPTSATVTSAASGELRCGYQGCLVEPGRTNLLLYSSALDNAAWASDCSTSLTVTGSAGTAPDGSTSATRLQVGAVGTTDRCLRYQGITGTAASWVASCWVKGTSASQTLYLTITQGGATGPKPGYATCSVTSTTWTRCATSPTTLTAAPWYFAIGADTRTGSGAPTPTSSGQDVMVWGCQWEQGTWASSLIPTTTTATARAADVLSVPSSVLGSGAASLHLVLTPEWASSVDATLVSSTNENELVLSTVDDRLDWLIGGNDISTSALGWSAGTAQTLDAWYTPGGQYRVTDGTHSASKSSASTPSPGHQLYLGGTSSAGAGVAISQVKVCKRAGVCR